MPRKKKDYGEIKNYKVIDGGIWIPKEECQRLTELFKKLHDDHEAEPPMFGMVYNVEGFRRLYLLYNDFAERIEKEKSEMAYTYKYPRPSMTADCIVMTREAEPKVLLIQRGDQPFKGSWAFPGGFMNMDETTEQCAVRELEEETGLRLTKIHQIGAYSKLDRDPRGRTITVAYLAVIDAPVAVTGLDDAAKAEWWPLSDLPHLAFDHYDIIQDAIKVYSHVIETKEKTLHDQFKEQKERMHEISNQIREQCTRVQELCSSYTKKEKK